MIKVLGSYDVVLYLMWIGLAVAITCHLLLAIKFLRTSYAEIEGRIRIIRSWREFPRGTTFAFLEKRELLNGLGVVLVRHQKPNSKSFIDRFGVARFISEFPDELADALSRNISFSKI